MAGLATAAAIHPERALAAWPERNVTLMHGLAPGGGVDVSARLIAEGLSRRLGQQVVVEPRPGAAATLAAAQVARATPDGYTLGFIPGSHAVTAATYKTLPYHPIDDFTIIGQALDVPFLVVTYAEHSIRNMPDLIKTAKARSEPLLCGMPGQGTSQHLLIEHLSRLAGIKIQPVAFRGGNLALNELLGKRLDFLIDPPIALLGQIKSGTLRAIAVTGGTRFPDCRTSAPSPKRASPAFPSHPGWAWSGRRNCRPDITTRLNAEIVALVAEPTMAAAHPRARQRAGVGAAREFKTLIAADIARWTKVVADAGIERVGGRFRSSMIPRVKPEGMLFRPCPPKRVRAGGNRCTLPGSCSSELRHRRDQPLDVLRPRQAMVAVLHHREHHVVVREPRGQLDRVLPRHVGVLHALQDAHRAAGLDQAAEQEMLAARPRSARG